MRRGARGPHWIARLSLALLLLAVIVAGWDFAAFVARVGRLRTPDDMPRADAVVVLTGAPGRIAHAVDLVARGAGARLLVSGVHPDISEADLRGSQGGSAAIWECCVDLGRQATSTLENADETAEWVRAHGYRRLILVTSDYHVPRALVELSRALPEVEFLPWPVRTGIDPNRAWSEPRAFRQVFLEWAKYRTTLLFGPLDIELPERLR